ncbi:hypothetical protein [uncultured Dokdonia sp.]|uniref:hypothetical protein n=1 Tax=uncultured Dokdonia sp. TaxID=575653 RepID=UPI0026020A33|nr:hypothetical protein [uncultured Dokdonia sp.]
MKYIIRSLSYIFHPLFMPIAGVLLYFKISPRFFNTSFLFSKLFATTIMTIIIPILSYYMLKNLNLVSDINLKNVKERRYPLLMQLLFTFLLIQIVFKGYEIPELHFFFVGILGSSLAALILALFNFKTSLHMIGISGLVAFIIGLSIHFNQNLLLLIAFLIIGCGGTATSRLDAKAHTYRELIIGFFVGSLPQLMSFKYWL